MNLAIETPSRPCAAPLVPPPALAEPADDAAEARVRHLFRTLSRAGLVHPLQHLILRYRTGEAGE